MAGTGLRAAGAGVRVFPANAAQQERCVMIALLLLFTTPAQAGPRQIPGQPPIVKVKPQGVKPYWLQVFDVDAKDVDLTEISIAARYYSWQGRTPDAAPMTVTVDCDVDVAYGVHPCLNRSIPPNDRTQAKVAVSQIFSRAVKFPSVPALREDQKKWLPDPLKPGEPALRRVARFSYRIEPPPERGIDPALGPLVESPNLPEIRGMNRPISYPPAREAQGLQANVTLECQVQADLSVICGNAMVDPPEHARWFSDPLGRTPLYWKSVPKLPDGRDARGVRFRKTVRFMWPE
ncbi:MAG TPA: hypothetical protein PKA59_08235 [Chakrabartia sp.]|nr:hypothetical protein [Chakrabartia sp.]